MKRSNASDTLVEGQAHHLYAKHISSDIRTSWGSKYQNILLSCLNIDGGTFGSHFSKKKLPLAGFSIFGPKTKAQTKSRGPGWPGLQVFALDDSMCIVGHFLVT